MLMALSSRVMIWDNPDGAPKNRKVHIRRWQRRPRARIGRTLQVCFFCLAMRLPGKTGQGIADEKQRRVILADRPDEEGQRVQPAAKQALIGTRDIDRNHHGRRGIAAGGDKLVCDRRCSGAAHIDGQRAVIRGKFRPMDIQRLVAARMGGEEGQLPRTAT